MKQLKKTLLTLVALLAVTTGAWAQAPTIYFQQDYSTGTVDWTTGTGGRYTPIIRDGYLTVNQDQRSNNGTTLTCTATQGKVDAGKDFTMTFNVKLGASTQHTDTEFNIYDAANSAPILSLAEGSAGATAWKINGGTQTATVSAGGGKSLNELSWIFVQVTSIAGGKTYLTLKDDQNNIIDGFDKTEIPTISVAGGLGKMTFVTSRYSANFAIDNVLVCDVVNDAASSGPEVAWNKAEKTGSFTMPGGNVTLEPEYYPQATVADGGVTAADADARATTDDPLVKVDATKLTGAKKLMYFVSNSGTTAPAYDAEGWTDQLPNAEGFTQQGIVYVWYYPVGIDEGVDGATATYSDGDICLQSITARIAAAPTYAVTFADDTAEPTLWSASPAADVKKGQTVTVTYSGTKKVIGVKAEKKKAAPAYTLLSAATTEDVGKVVCAAGHLHDAKTAVPDGCTAVGILGKVTETGHGLIIALQEASEQEWNTINSWTSVTTYAGTTLKVLPDAGARGNLSSYETLGETIAVSNWAVAQVEDYDAIFKNLGSTKSDSGSMLYDDNVNDYITTGVGGTALSGEYWSAAEYGDYGLSYYDEGWSGGEKSKTHKIRPVLGF